jgi:hypothetical protein
MIWFESSMEDYREVSAVNMPLIYRTTTWAVSKSSKCTCSSWCQNSRRVFCVIYVTHGFWPLLLNGFLLPIMNYSSRIHHPDMDSETCGS